MGIRGIVAGTALSLALSIPGASTALAGETGPSKAAADQEGSKRVCRNLTHTGTRLSRRTCKRQSEWDEAAIRARKHLTDLQTNSLRSDINGQ